MSTESPKTYFFWSGNALPDPPCYDQYTADDIHDDDDVDVDVDDVVDADACYEGIPDRGLAFTSEDFTTLDCDQKRSRQLFGGYCLM